MSVNQMSDDQMSDDQMYVDQMYVDQMSDALGQILLAKWFSTKRRGRLH
jgi:hypothetical protein